MFLFLSLIFLSPLTRVSFLLIKTSLFWERSREMNDEKNRRARTLSTRSWSVKREWKRVGKTRTEFSTRESLALFFQYRSDEFLSQWKWTVSLKVYTSITREKTDKSDDEGVAASFEKNITLRFLSLRKTILWSTRRRQGKQEEKKEMKEEKLEKVFTRPKITTLDKVMILHQGKKQQHLQSKWGKKWGKTWTTNSNTCLVDGSYTDLVGGGLNEMKRETNWSWVRGRQQRRQQRRQQDTSLFLDIHAPREKRDIPWVKEKEEDKHTRKQGQRKERKWMRCWEGFFFFLFLPRKGSWRKTDLSCHYD